MESIINALTSNKVLLAIAILLLSVIIYSILKRLIKIIVIIIIALVLYMGYMNYRGEKIDETLQNYLNKGEKELTGIQKNANKISDVIDSASKTAK